MDAFEERIRRAVSELVPEGWFTAVRTTEAGEREVGFERYVSEDTDERIEVYLVSAKVIYVLTSAPEEVAVEWSERLQASLPVEEGWSYQTPRAAPPLREGYRIWRLWWD